LAAGLGVSVGVAVGVGDGVGDAVGVGVGGRGVLVALGGGEFVGVPLAGPMLPGRGVPATTGYVVAAGWLGLEV